MSSTKKLKQAAQRFRKENPELYTQYAAQCHSLAEQKKEYDNQSNKQHETAKS